MFILVAKKRAMSLYVHFVVKWRGVVITPFFGGFETVNMTSYRSPFHEGGSLISV